MTAYGGFVFVHIHVGTLNSLHLHYSTHLPICQAVFWKSALVVYFDPDKRKNAKCRAKNYLRDKAAPAYGAEIFLGELFGIHSDIRVLRPSGA